MSGKKPYFPNNWEEYANTPDKHFIPHTFVELMTWKVAGWELPSSVFCIIRTQDKKSKKVKEYVYSRPRYAQAAVDKLIRNPDLEFTVCDHESIHFVSAEEIPDNQGPDRPAS